MALRIPMKMLHPERFFTFWIGFCVDILILLFLVVYFLEGGLFDLPSKTGVSTWLRCLAFTRPWP
jgi:hypothetical protein